MMVTLRQEKARRLELKVLRIFHDLDDRMESDPRCRSVYADLSEQIFDVVKEALGSTDEPVWSAVFQELESRP